MFPEAVVLALDRIGGCLESLGVRFALMGGMAVASWKHPRFTQDVDLLIASEVANSDRLIAALTQTGFRPKRQPPIVTIGDSRFVQLLYEPPEVFMDIQIDLLFAETEFQKQSLRRRTPMELEGVQVPLAVVSCEDLIIFKLLANRVLDRSDAAAVLRINRTMIDRQYLKKWVQELGLQPQWAEIWNEAFPGEEDSH